MSKRQATVVQFERAERMLSRALAAEAKIQAVRDVCADQAFWAEGSPDAGLVRAVTVEAVFTALDGAS